MKIIMLVACISFFLLALHEAHGCLEEPCQLERFGLVESNCG